METGDTCRTISQQFPALNAIVTSSFYKVLNTYLHPYNCCYTFIKYQHVLLNIHAFTTSNVAGTCIIISLYPLPEYLKLTGGPP